MSISLPIIDSAISSVRKALVVNCSQHHYNLGAHKLVNWLTSLGVETTYFSGDPLLQVYAYDLICLSVIFSHHAPMAAEIALRAKGFSQVWCGGPGVFDLKSWWQKRTGIPITIGLDKRFERQRGEYRMTFASRGCPVGCYFCIVPRLEGKEFTLYWDFDPAPILCDNNLSALPDDFQDHILRRYVDAGVKLIDANSGFEPRTFTEKTYQRWKPHLRGPWRFAFDEQRETAEVHQTMKTLANESPRRKQVWVLCGNEPVESCYERAMKVIEWGGEPFCQFIRPLTWLGGPLPMPFDWTPTKMIDLCRYFNRHVWRSATIWEYSNRKDERPTFEYMKAKSLASV